jgi:hypothetical protein
MKCIQCNTDNTLKDRTGNGGCCKSCRHRFVFEPTTMGTPKITDPKFKKTIDDLSVNGTLCFTQSQLAYFLDKRLRPVSRPILADIFLYVFINAWITGMVGGVVGLIFGGFAASIGINLPPNFFLVAVNLVLQAVTINDLFQRATSNYSNAQTRRSSSQRLGLLGLIILLVGIPVTLFMVPAAILLIAVVCLSVGAVYLSHRELARPKIGQTLLFRPQDLENWLHRWQAINGKIPQLLPPPVTTAGAATVNPDVTAYSFDRLVVCESDDIAQMLIANNFHFENNCAILSIGGYPQNIFDVTMQMLRRNPDLKVYLLHDCTIAGMGLLQQLQQSEEWFKDGNVTVIDAGLRPSQVMAAKDMFIQSSTAAQQAKYLKSSQFPDLSQSEVDWLVAGTYVELASFTPQQLIQVLNRGIAGTRELLANNDDGISFSGGYIYSTESFG